MLTPKEISEKTFNKTFGFGYRMDDVDEFLKQAAASVTEHKNRSEELERKLEVLAEKLTEYRSDEESLRTALLGAQKLGDSVIRESKTKAEIIMRDATIKAEAMVSNAKHQIEKEQDGLIAIQKEVGSFKGRLLDLYKQHLELISALPGKNKEEEPAKKEEELPQDEQSAEIKEEEPANLSVTSDESLEEPAEDIDQVKLGSFDDDDDESDDDDDEEESKFGELRFGDSFKFNRDK